MKSVAMTKVHICLPKEFLQDLDERAAALLMSRSMYIRLALIEKMGRSLVKVPPNPFQPYIEQLAALDQGDVPDTIAPGSP